MTRLTILEFPDPRLRTRARPVEDIDDSTRQLVADMLETMYDAKGIGLAATQVNVHFQVIVIDVSEDMDQPQVFINPRIEVLEGGEREYDEGCLSIPGFYETVVRPERIRVHALNERGEAFSLEPDGLLAVCIQHEMDHLNGKLFVDYISPLKRQRIRQKLEKRHKEQAHTGA